MEDICQKAQWLKVLFMYGSLVVLMSLLLLRYQPPLPAEQVKAFAEFDYEGGNTSCQNLCVYLLN